MNVSQLADLIDKANKSSGNSLDRYLQSMAYKIKIENMLLTAVLVFVFIMIFFYIVYKIIINKY